MLPSPCTRPPCAQANFQKSHQGSKAEPLIWMTEGEGGAVIESESVRSQPLPPLRPTLVLGPHAHARTEITMPCGDLQALLYSKDPRFVLKPGLRSPLPSFFEHAFLWTPNARSSPSFY